MNGAFSFTACQSPNDFITLESWDENPPDLFIRFIELNGRSRMDCYHKETLKEWIKNPENTFADWIHNPLARKMDEMGHGGMPGRKRFYKLYTQEFIPATGLSVAGPYFNLALETSFIIYLEMTAIGIERIGNTRGSIAEPSVLHGQLPGFTVYQFSKVKLLDYDPQTKLYSFINKTISELTDKLLNNPRYSLIDKLMILSEIRNTYHNNNDFGNKYPKNLEEFMSIIVDDAIRNSDSDRTRAGVTGSTLYPDLFMLPIINQNESRFREVENDRKFWKLKFFYDFGREIPYLPGSYLERYRAITNPDNLFTLIMEKMNPHDIVLSCEIEPSFKSLCSDQNFWKILWYRDYSVNTPYNFLDRSYRELYHTLSDIRDIEILAILAIHFSWEKLLTSIQSRWDARGAKKIFLFEELINHPEKISGLLNQGYPFKELREYCFAITGKVDLHATKQQLAQILQEEIQQHIFFRKELIQKIFPMKRANQSTIIVPVGDEAPIIINQSNVLLDPSLSSRIDVGLTGPSGNLGSTGFIGDTGPSGNLGSTLE